MVLGSLIFPNDNKTADHGAMKFETFTEDPLERGDFAKGLIDFIEVEHHFVDGSLVVSLSSPYGTGKTTFLRMLQQWLGTQASAPKVISLNAWESDYCGDPLFAIVSALVEEFEKSKTPETTENVNKVIEAAKDIGWMALAVGGQIVKNRTGFSPLEAGAFAEKRKADRKASVKMPTDTFSAFRARVDAMKSLQAAIHELVCSSEVRVLFLVDELDRCRPDYAITFLETIKHLFDSQGAVFILAADRKQLENSARLAFGTDLDFNEYLRKFVHREVALPKISNVGYQKLSGHYVGHYLLREKLRKVPLDMENKLQFICELCSALELSPRQIQEVFRIVGHAVNIVDSEGSESPRSVGWCSYSSLVFLSAFRVGRPEVYSALGRAGLAIETAHSILLNDLHLDKWDWWFQLLLSGGGLQAVDRKEHPAVLAKVGLDDSETYSQFLQGWRFQTGIPDLYARIETASKVWGG